MADFVFNISKGRVVQLAELEGATDSLVAVPLEAADLEADSVLIDYETLADIYAGGSALQTDMNPQELGGISTLVDHDADISSADADDPTWTAATGNPVGKLLVCYVPDDTATDADIIPMCAFDWDETPDGSDLPARFNTAGFFTAEGV